MNNIIYQRSQHNGYKFVTVPKSYFKEFITISLIQSFRLEFKYE